MTRLPLFILVCLALSLGCRPSGFRAATPDGAPPREGAPLGDGATMAPDEEALPVHPEDARWGSESAPVTVIALFDLECPFCLRALPTLRALMEQYGPEKLSIVVKHHPLPFHSQGVPAALAAIEVTQTGGDEALFAFLSLVERGGELTPEKLSAWKAAVLSGRAPRTSTIPPSAQLGRDLALAERVGARGTPAFFVNGLLIPGAQPVETFQATIDGELRFAEEMRQAGKAVTYAQRVRMNFEPVVPEAPAAPEEPVVDTTVWKVPLGTSPSLGPSDALVTIVEFSDYQCPFCKRVHPTLKEVLARHPADVRLVWKHHPLSFHPHARPAARLAEAVRKRRGEVAFWEATEALLDLPAGEMDEESLLAAAARLGLGPRDAKKAVTGTEHDALIDADVELSMDLEAGGTPHFFINGRRLSGAQPLEEFLSSVDAALAEAGRLVSSGVARAKVYETLMLAAAGPPPPPRVEGITAPPGRPTRGPANAKVEILAFGDFECPFCRRAAPTLEALLREFPKDVRLVWLNMPLDFHDQAPLAAAVALEMRRRGGDAAFWKMHDLLVESSVDLSEEGLRARIRRAGGDADAVLQAAKEGRHDAALAEDRELAKRAGIRGTPAFVINGYLVSGAQPLSVFRRTVRRALADLDAAKATP